MAVAKSYARLGFFVVVALVVMIATALFFIQRVRTRESIEMVTYTTENVSGLDISSPVRYRGVSIGQVTDVRADPRGMTVEIDFEVFLDRLNTIGSNVAQIRQITDLGGIFPKLRAMVVGNPVTGEAYLLLDFPENPPPPAPLSFKPSRPYVASMPTMMSKMQDRLPEFIDRAEATLQTVHDIITRIPASLDRSDRFFTNVERVMREANLPALSADSRAFFTTTSAQIGQMASNMEKVLGTGGTLEQLTEEARSTIKAADLPATTAATRTASHQMSLTADDLRRSLPALRESLGQLRELAKLLEEQPEAVVYGPRPPKGKSR